MADYIGARLIAPDPHAAPAANARRVSDEAAPVSDYAAELIAYAFRDFNAQGEDDDMTPDEARQLQLRCSALAKMLRCEYPADMSLYEIAQTWATMGVMDAEALTAEELEALRDA